MALKGLLSHLAHELNLKKLELDEKGRCNFEITGPHLLSIERSIHEGEFLLYSVVAEVAEDQEALVFRLALEGNLFDKETGEASLGFHPETRSILLFQRFNENNLPETLFIEKFRRFIQYLEHWKEKLSTERLAHKTFDGLKKDAEEKPSSDLKRDYA